MLVAAHRRKKIEIFDPYRFYFKEVHLRVLAGEMKIKKKVFFSI
jgi:hypothetical protein